MNAIDWYHRYQIVRQTILYLTKISERKQSIVRTYRITLSWCIPGLRIPTKVSSSLKLKMYDKAFNGFKEQFRSGYNYTSVNPASSASYCPSRFVCRSQKLLRAFRRHTCHMSLTRTPFLTINFDYYYVGIYAVPVGYRLKITAAGSSRILGLPRYL